MDESGANFGGFQSRNVELLVLKKLEETHMRLLRSFLSIEKRIENRRPRSKSPFAFHFIYLLSRRKKCDIKEI